MAIAGGVTVRVPHKSGYLYQEAGILSPDGHCRAFDAAAQGTVVGNGVGVVVLKRLADALADHDHIYAVILGSAMNNDGASKVGYTAPSEDGQAAVIAEVLGVANIEPHTVSYIETHGTGTALGDQVEIAALTQIFGTDVKRKGSCAIGSVKTNIGHLDVAAGIAGLIKTALALKHQVIPPSLHFEQANPHIELANSPFYVNTHLTDWQAGPHPRRAGVSAFGVGGTNVHVVLEEPPILPPARSEEHYQLLLLSAKTQDALERATVNLATYLKQHPDVALSDVAYTLQVGRKPFTHRRFLVCRDRRDAIAALETLDAKRLTTSASLGPPHHHEADDALLLSTLGKRWAAGMDVNWAHVQNPSKSARIPLPTYAFERQRYWIEPTESPSAPMNGEQKSETPVLGTLYPRPKMLHVCVPPRNQREATIAEMWQQLLGIESIGIHDNFFDLGGDSLLALQLINQLDNHFQIKVLRHHIAEAPTIDSLNQLLQTLSEQTSDNIEIHNTPLVLLKDGTRSPLFCIHPAGGTVLCYVDLARLLDSDQPLYGLQAPDLYGGPNHESIEATASYYLDVVRSVQPQGPYYLGGLSYGGNVAFEMARQLHQQGAKVDLLALFDSHPLTAYAYPTPDRASFLTAFPWILSLYLKRERELITYDDVQQHNPQEQLEYVFERVKAAGLVPPGMDSAQLRQYFDVWNVHHHALRLYDPPHKCYPQPITLFRAAQEQPAELLALLNIQLNGSIPIAGWEILSTAPIQVYETPGSHYTMLNKPHVVVLAQHLNTLLARNN
jgi:thioesterase domain-containing protein/acyl carrier protein